MMIDTSSCAPQYQYPTQSPTSYNPYDQQIQPTCEFAPFKPTSCIDIKPRTFRDHRLEAYRDAYETATGFEDDEMFCPYELLQVSHLVLSGKLPDSEAPYHNPKKPFKGNLTSLISNSQLLSEHLRDYPLYYTVTKSPPHRNRKIYQVSNDANTRPSPSHFQRENASVHPLSNFTEPNPLLYSNNVGGYFGAVSRGGIPNQPMSVPPPPHYADFLHYPPLKGYYPNQQGYSEPSVVELRKHKKSSWYIPRKNTGGSSALSSDRTGNNWLEWDEQGNVSGTSSQPTSSISSEVPPRTHANPTSAETFGDNGTGPSSFQPVFECDPIYHHHSAYVTHPQTQLSATSQEFQPTSKTLLSYLNKGNPHPQPPDQQQQQQQQQRPHPQQDNQHQHQPQQQKEESHTTLDPHQPATSNTLVNTENTPNPNPTSHVNGSSTTRSTKPHNFNTSSRPRYSHQPKSARARTTSLSFERENTAEENGRSSRQGWWRRGEKN